VPFFIYWNTITQAKNKLYANLQLMPFFLLLWFETQWLKIGFTPANLAWVFLIFGFAFTCMDIKMIICSTTKDRYELFHLEVLVLAVLTLVFMGYEQKLNELGIANTVFFSTLFFIFLKQLLFLSNVIEQIAASLDIYVFTLGKRSKSKSK
jgi:predicted MFS family arabinose efflux permease